MAAAGGGVGGDMYSTCDVRCDGVVFTHHQPQRCFMSLSLNVCTCVVNVVIMMNVFAAPGLRSSCLQLTPPCVGGDISRPRV